MMVSESLWRVAFSYGSLLVQITSGAAFVLWYLSMSPNIQLVTILSVGLIVIILQLGSAIEFGKLRTLIKLIKTV